MKIGIVGGGPAGLYFALLMKQHDPTHLIRVVEQNPPDATYGWGVVFSDKAQSYLEATTPELYQQLLDRMETWDDLTIVHHDEAVRIDGNGFAGIARIELLNLLQEQCRRVGVALEFERRLESLAALADCDLIVGADGVNSMVRSQLTEAFRPTISHLTNYYIWYGTQAVLDTLSLIFRSNDDGYFVGHAYRFNKTTSTFIVECDDNTFQAAGLGQMDDDQSRRYCEAVFAPDLHGHAFLLNKAQWLNFRVVTNERWSHQNVVLLGDALRSVHFSIGSGTRLAMEDAMALYNACIVRDSVPEMLAEFERARRPIVNKLLRAAEQSYVWYEAFDEQMQLAPNAYELAYSYMTRSGRIDPEKLRRLAPRFAAGYERQRLENRS